MKQATLNPKEEAQFKELNRLGQILHVPIPQASWKLEVFLRGDLIQSYEARSHSWVRNAYNWMFSQMAGKAVNDAAYGAGKLNMKDTAGVVQNGLKAAGIRYSSNPDGVGIVGGGYRAIAGDDDYGILVGSGTDAESFESHILQTKIANGVAGGEINYVESEPHSISYAALTLKNELIRYFNNNSGGNINVNEVGMAADAESYNNSDYLVCRDKLGSTVTIPDTGQLKVTYTLSLVYPA